MDQGCSRCVSTDYNNAQHARQRKGPCCAPNIQTDRAHVPCFSETKRCYMHPGTSAPHTCHGHMSVLGTCTQLGVGREGSPTGYYWCTLQKEQAYRSNAAKGQLPYARREQASCACVFRALKWSLHAFGALPGWGALKGLGKVDS